MIICEYLQVPCSATARVQDGDGRDKRWVKQTLSSSVIASKLLSLYDVLVTYTGISITTTYN